MNAQTQYDRGDMIVINAPAHEAHGMRALVRERKTGEADVYTVRLLGVVGGRAYARYQFGAGELLPAPGCSECSYRGWVVMDDSDSDDAQHIERCDTCRMFATDDDALDAAEAGGYTAPGCLCCFSRKCGLCGHCHYCEDDDLRPACTRGEFVETAVVPAAEIP